MLRAFRLGAVAAAIGLIAAGCSDDPNAPNQSIDGQQLDLDVALYAAEATADDIQLMTTEADLIMRAPVAAPPIGDLSISRDVTFLDEAGEEMPAFDPDLTASIAIAFNMTGSRSRVGQRGTMSVAVSRARDVVVSGLLGRESERTWNGSGSASRNRSLMSDANGDREYHFSATTEIDYVVIPVPRQSGWPLSGVIRRQVTVEIIRGEDDPVTRERTVEVSFNGTRFVPVTVNGQGFTLDLKTREIVEPEE